MFADKKGWEGAYGDCTDQNEGENQQKMFAMEEQKRGETLRFGIILIIDGERAHRALPANDPIFELHQRHYTAR